MKTPMSRFTIHDELNAPEASIPVLRGALTAGGQLPNFVGVLAGSPAALRAYARFRSELRHGKLTLATLERIALAVAEHYQSEPGIAMHSRAARAAGLALDEVALARASANGTLMMGSIDLASVTTTNGHFSARVSLLPETVLAVVFAAVLTWAARKLFNGLRARNAGRRPPEDDA